MVVLLMHQIVNKVVISNVFISDNVSPEQQNSRNSIIDFFHLDDLNLANGILYSRSCPPGLWFSTLNDRCDYPSAVQC
jgi:hypothetical protein